MSDDPSLDHGPTMAGELQTVRSAAESTLGADEVVCAAINEAVGASFDSRERLRRISTYTRRKGGLRNDHVRRLAWPILLGCTEARGLVSKPERDASSIDHQPLAQTNWRGLPEHKDEAQVQLDVDRSFVYYPNDKTESQLDRLKADLFDVITATLRRHPKLSYFQGFHDIAQVLLLVLGKDRAFDAVAHLSLLRLRDFMLPNLTASIAQVELLPAILAAADPALARHLSRTKPFFALAATLTMFSHDVESYSEIARLFDFLLAEEAVMAIYLFASIILTRRAELLSIPVEEEDILSFTLSKLPKSLDFEAIIDYCVSLIEMHPPQKLPHRAWARVSCYSVLKTTENRTLHGPSDAEKFLDAQLLHLAWQKRRQQTLSVLWHHRKSVGGVGAAVLVALLSYWVQKGTGAAVIANVTSKMLVLGKLLLQLVYDHC